MKEFMKTIYEWTVRNRCKICDIKKKLENISLFFLENIQQVPISKKILRVLMMVSCFMLLLQCTIILSTFIKNL